MHHSYLMMRVVFICRSIDPLVEIKVCLGFCPPVKVSSYVLPQPPAPPQLPSENSLTENNVDILEELLDDDNSLLDPEYEMSKDNTSDEESLVGDEYVSENEDDEDDN